MAITRFLDPKNDYVFRKIFGTEKNKDVLIGFLNQVLDLKDDHQIIDVTFLNPKLDAEIAAFRQSIVDVLCQDQNGVQTIIEMQVTRHPGFEKRAQYYAAKAYSQQLIEEDEHYKKMAVYAKLKAVIFLAIADFIMFPDKKAWQSEHTILDNKTYDHDLKDFRFIFMELPKFNKKLAELDSIQEKWLYFFKHAKDSTLEEIEKLIGQDIIMKKAFFAIDQASWTKEELGAYEQREKNLLDNQVIEDYKIFEAQQKGKAEGIEQGVENTAINMLKAKLDDKLIRSVTGFTQGALDKLKNKM